MKIHDCCFPERFHVGGKRHRRGPVLDHPVCKGVEVVAHSDMNGRPDALQMAYQQVGESHYLYVGHFWSGGTSILDVTDPGKPVVAGFIPASNKDTWQIKVQVADNILMIPCEVNGFGVDVDYAEARKGVRFLDASNPTDPKDLSFYEVGEIGVHRSWWNGGQYAYLSAGTVAPMVNFHGVPGMTRIMTILDVSDPRKPRKVSDFWLPEQLGEGKMPGDGETYYVHEPVVEGDRAYVAYLDGGFAIVDLSDRSRPELITRVQTFPELGDGSTHTCVPLPGRNMLLVIEECMGNWGSEGEKNIWLWDISNEEHPEPVAKFPRPEPSPEEPYTTYIERGDRFGPHCLHENYKNQFKSADTVYATYCNAGLRIYDITDPASPQEVGSFVPPDPDSIVDPRPYDRFMDIFHSGSRTACSQDIAIDPRGYIYLSGTNDGLWILKRSES